MNDILLFLLGVFIGFLISYYFKFFVRRVLGIKPKYTTYFYDATTDEICLSTNNRDNHHLYRFVLIKDKLDDTITLNFTDFYFKGNKYRLARQFKFGYYDRCYAEDKYFITLYKNNQLLSFINDIIFIPRGTMSTNERDALEVFKIDLGSLK